MDEQLKNPEVMIQPRRQIAQWLPFFLTFVSVVGGIHSLLGWGVFHEDLFSWGQKLAVALLEIIGVVLLPLSFISNMSSRPPLPKIVTKYAFIWLGFFWMWLSFSLAAFVTSFVVLLVWPQPSLIFSSPLSSAFLLVAGLLPLALWEGHRFPRVTQTRVTIKDLPSVFEGIKIVQLSDIHVGMLHLQKEFMTKVVETVNSLQPDIVAITGDLVEGPLLKVAPALQPLADVQAPFGRFMVTGNHEYYHGGHVWEKIVSALGWTVLLNSHHVIKKDGSHLQIVGVTDFMAGRIDPNSASRPDLAFKGVNPQWPVIFLAHEPRSFGQAEGQRIDLQLSGHTHGGQIFPLNLLVYTQQPTNRGLKRIKQSWIYTHMGTGFWGPPMRLGTHAEIAVLTLHRE